MVTENRFTTAFRPYTCEGDTITAHTDYFDITARIERDDCCDAPQDRNDGFWPSLDPKAAGYIGENPQVSYTEQLAKALAIMTAWEQDEWFYCGIVLSVSRNGVLLNNHAASLWGIECNYPDSDNAYLTEVANELIDEALAEGKKVLAKLAA